jgi:uncharacterized membrane protein
MLWSLRYRVQSFLRSSLWFYPLLSIGAALLAAAAVRSIDGWTGWTAPLSADGARALAGTLASALLTFIVFVFSVLLVAVQLASAQQTPRVIALVLQDRRTRAALTVFVFTYTYALSFLARVEEPVPWLSTLLCEYSSLACIAAFLVLIDRVGKRLRPVGVLTLVAAAGRKVIRQVYPRPVTDGPEEPPAPEGLSLGEPARVVRYTRAPGVVLAFDVRGLVKAARRADCVIELAPEVGDFVATDDPLFRVYQGGQSLDEDGLRRAVALGAERTLEQDPAFALRVIVDIASKSLSPAINDPTTAVLAIDQLHHLLRLVGGRRLDDGRVRDAAGKLRLIYRTPNWEDFVLLAVTEIRQFGGTSMQVARRLRAMLENLMASLPPERTPLLRRELTLLQRTVERAFRDPEDRARADAGDLQGVGGARPGNGAPPGVDSGAGDKT